MSDYDATQAFNREAASRSAESTRDEAWRARAKGLRVQEPTVERRPGEGWQSYYGRRNEERTRMEAYAWRLYNADRLER